MSREESLRILEEFAELTKDVPVTFDPTRGYPHRGHHSAPGGLRAVPLGEYLTQVPPPFHHAPKEPQ